MKILIFFAIFYLNIFHLNTTPVGLISKRKNATKTETNNIDDYLGNG